VPDSTNCRQSARTGGGAGESAENRFRDAVKGGMSLTEAYAKFKVL
jgi:hypothetical protein